MDNSLLLRVDARVGINGNYGEFEPNFATVTYDDLNDDGKSDIKIYCRYKLYDEFDETVILKEGDYRRVFLHKDGQYNEDMSQRSGHNRFLD